MNEWKALMARITLFPEPKLVSSQHEQSALDLYKKVWEEEPDNFKKVNNPLIPSQAKGQHDGLAVACSANASRIDFTLTASATKPDLEMTQPSLLVIENSVGLHTELERIISVLEKNCVHSSIIRVAVYVKFISLKSNIEDANKALILIIPEQYRLKLGNEEDFILQVNNSGPSERLINVKMNLISKWTVDRIQILTMSIPAMVGVPPVVPQGLTSNIASTSEYIAATLSLDANNVPQQKISTSEQQMSLLREGLDLVSKKLVHYGLKIDGF